MDNAAMEETVKALYKLAMVQSGTIAAQRVMLDTVVSALGGLPTFVDVLDDTLSALGPVVRDDLEQEAVTAFDNTLAHYEQLLATIARREK